MSRGEIQKLLGGYATDTLSATERSALYEAALEDQELFDALAREQELREVLQHPSAREQLIAALGPERQPFAARMWRWWGQPAGLAVAAGMVTLLMVAGLMVRQREQKAHSEALLADALAAHKPAVVAEEPESMVFQEPAVRQPKRAARLPAPPVLPAKNKAALASPLALPEIESAAAAPAPPAAPQNFAPKAMRPVAGLSRAKEQLQAVVTPAMAYTLLLRGADGAYTPVPEGAIFHAGDSVRIQVDPATEGFISLFQRDVVLGWKLIASQFVQKGQAYELPAAGGLESNMPDTLELLLMQSHFDRAGIGGFSSADAGSLASQASAASRITIEFR